MFSTFNKLSDFILKSRGTFLKEEPRYYCDLETNADEYNFIGQSAERATMIRLQGLESIIGDEEFEECTPGVSDLFVRLFQSGHHVIDAGFSKDRDFTRREIDRCSESAYATAERLNLNLKDLIEEDDNVQEKYTIHEEQYIMVWTLPSAISQRERNETLNTKKSIMSQLTINWGEAQNYLKNIPALANYHDATINDILSTLNRLGFSAEKVDVHEAGKIMRMQILPHQTDFNWKPILAGDPLPIPKVMSPPPPKNDISDLLYPNLGWQICPNKVELEQGFVKVGNLYYATLNIEQFPNNESVLPFPLLFENVKHYIPWRIRFLMSGKGVSSQELSKVQLATFMAFTQGNRDLIQNVADIQAYEQAGGVAIRTRITVTTWARDISTLKTNYEELTRAVQAWGNPVVIEDKGDPRDSFFSSLVGYTRKSVATGTPVPTEKLVQMLPFYRPAAPWKTGSMKFRTIDGKPFYFQPNSSLQTVNINLINGKSRNGKGVLSNAMNMARCLSPGLIRLPRISIIEMEPSSLGFIRLLKNRLPANQSQEAIYHRMNIRDGINPFDTLPGLRSPTTSDREFLVDFLMILITSDANVENPYTEMRPLVKKVVDIAYTHFASYKTAKPYRANIFSDIDTYLTQSGFFDRQFESQYPSWWEVVDYLFLSGKEYESKRAQTLSVPTLEDVLLLANESPALKSLYEDVKHEGTQAYIDLFVRKLSEIISEYPCFSKPTEVFFSSARVISLDLADVATTPRSTAIFATFGAWITTRFFYIKKEKLPEVKEIYQRYYSSLLTNVKRDQKELIIEEYHRYHAVPGVSQMIERFMAEGGKDNVSTTVISQLLNAFTPNMRQMATNQFLLVAGISTEELDEMQKQLSLTNSEYTAIKEGLVHAPKQDGSGSSFLFRYTTKKDGSWKSQVLGNTRSSALLWHLSTTTNDTELREAVFDELGEEEGLKALLYRFPGGSANSYIEERKERLGKDYSKEKIDIIDEVAKDVIALFYRKTA
ncbi:MAG: hypothetical protein U9N57_01200 [Pseudomonadota bacterium]|nr:hypothetical protein [Pseudomonadota bacterium]